MNLKRFSIISAIIIVLMVATIITLGCVKVNNGLNIDDPSKILVYVKSTAAREVTLDERPGDYKKLKEAYEDMTNLSILDYVASGKSYKQKPSQDVNQEYETWKTDYKTKNYCVELIFENKQSVVVTIGNNTKVIDFYGLIMIVEKSSTGREVALYFSTTEDVDATKNYKADPILVNAKQNKLFEFIKDLEKQLEQEKQ